MKRNFWTDEEEALLFRHAESGAEASTALEFWGLLVPKLPWRAASAIYHRAAWLNLWARSLYGAVEHRCPCGIDFIKRTGNRNPAVAHLCVQCVRAEATLRRKENHKFICTRCEQPSRGGRRRRTCDSCKEKFGNKRVYRR